MYADERPDLLMFGELSLSLVTDTLSVTLQLRSLRSEPSLDTEVSGPKGGTKCRVEDRVTLN